MIPTTSHARGPDQPPIRELTIGDLLAQTAATAPDRTALIDSGSGASWTYRELHTAADQFARWLAAKYAPSERIAIWGNNVPAWIVAEFAGAMAGLVIVTVNPAFTADEARYVLRQSGASAVLAIRNYRGVDLVQVARGLRPDCPRLRDVADLHEVAFVPPAAELGAELPNPGADDDAMIQYTSGTTGRPKGAVLHHRGIVNNGHHTLHRLGVHDGDVILTVMPLFHTAGSVVCVLGGVANGATQVLVETFEPAHVLDTIEKYSINVVLGVPTMLQAIVEHPTFATRDLGSVRVVASGGATVPPSLVQHIEDRLGARFVIVMGQTEASPVSAMTEPGDSAEDRANTIGTAMPGVEIKIVDPHTNEAVPPGVPGEYCTRGYHVMRGYFDMPAEAEATIDGLGWLHSGDLCSMDERGYCRVVGRLKDMIIRGGENIYPREIEDRLLEHPDVGEVAVIGVPHARWGEVAAAFVRAIPGATLREGELRSFLRQTLAPYKTPQHWYSVDALPLTSSGKIQKYKLREIWAGGATQELGD